MAGVWHETALRSLPIQAVLEFYAVCLLISLPTENSFCVGVIRMKEESCYCLMAAVATWRTLGMLSAAQGICSSALLSTLPSAEPRSCSAYWLSFVKHKEDQRQTKHYQNRERIFFFFCVFLYACGLKHSSQGQVLIPELCFKVL